MIEATYTFELPLPPATVFGFIADPRHDSQWQSSCAGVELLSPAPTIGSRYRIAFNFLSRKMNFLAQIIESEAPSRYAFQVIEGPFTYSGSYVLTPQGTSTCIQWNFRAEPGRFFGVIPAGLLRKVLVAQVERDVKTMRKVLLSHAGMSEGEPPRLISA